MLPRTGTCNKYIAKVKCLQLEKSKYNNVSDVNRTEGEFKKTEGTK